MKYQNFIMRILCLLLILAAVVGYNSMQKKDTQAQESQEITALTKRVEKLEEQNTEILSALEEAAKNQEAAIAQAQRDAKDKDNAAKEDAEGADAADTEESDDSENVYKDGTYIPGIFDASRKNSLRSYPLFFFSLYRLRSAS